MCPKQVVVKVAGFFSTQVPHVLRWNWFDGICIRAKQWRLRCPAWTLVSWNRSIFQKGPVPPSSAFLSPPTYLSPPFQRVRLFAAAPARRLTCSEWFQCHLPIFLLLSQLSTPLWDKLDSQREVVPLHNLVKNTSNCNNSSRLTQIFRTVV